MWISIPHEEASRLESGLLLSFKTIEEKGWQILELAVQPDHVHLFVRAWPSDSAADVIKEIKGVTAHHLRKEFSQLLKLPSLWTRSYFAATAGNVSKEIIQKYIEAQKGL